MSEQLIVETHAGKVCGVRQINFECDEFYAFRGVPYAKPPIGQLRFQDPQPLEPWTGVRETTNHGPNCAQLDIITGEIIGSDDCLYLNVYSKNLKPEEKLPVMFWIHGGAFSLGHGDDSMYGPDYFMRKDVVLVTINYRLGCLGFLNIDDKAATGNQGLKDQVMALKWVRDNIANFGGDPDNVTIFGESAGAASVHYLCFSPLAKGLFHKVICQSGVALNPWAFKSNPEEYAYRLCELLGHTGTDPKAAVEFLQGVDVLKLMASQGKILKKEERIQFVFSFGPSIDNKSSEPFMPVHPEIAYTEGIDMPLMIGYNSREGIIFLRVLNKVCSRFNLEYDTLLHPKAVDTLKKVYNLTPENLKKIYFDEAEISQENIDKFVDMFGDVHFVEGIHRVLKTQVEKSSAPTYLYQFTYDKESSLVKLMSRTSMSGASHADEIIYMFPMQSITTMRNQYGHPRKSWYQIAKWYVMTMPLIYLVKLSSFGFPKKGSVKYRISEQMVDMWTNFAKTGKPTNGQSQSVPIDWPLVEDSNDLRYLNICENLSAEVVRNISEKYNIQKS